MAFIGRMKTGSVALLTVDHLAESLREHTETIRGHSQRLRETLGSTSVRTDNDRFSGKQRHIACDIRAAQIGPAR